MDAALQDLIEDAVSRAGGRSFNLARLADACLGLDGDPLGHAVPILSGLQNALEERAYRAIVSRLIRCAFLIQPVEPIKVNTTLYSTRWAPRLSASDPRRQSPNGCMEVFRRAVELTSEAVDQQKSRDDLLDILNLRVLAHEIPLDYKDRHATPIHSSENITWVGTEVLRPLARQRKVLLQGLPRADSIFFKAVYRKVAVKTYLTDRVLTGEYKTNREYRWEVHPRSVHFALRSDCMAIEEKLISALCAIEDLPLDLAELLEDEELRDDGAPTRCPITLDPMEYELLRRELLAPVAGISSYQVGHMNPLKAVNDDPCAGHTAANVAWVSQDGNRIQGHLTLDATRAMLSNIAKNYESFGLVNGAGLQSRRSEPTGRARVPRRGR